MVPSSVINAWNELPEKKKIEVVRLCAQQQPLIFERWITAAGVKSFRPDSIMKRKAGAGARLDGVLFKAEQGGLAADLLVGYFTGMNTQINDKYLELSERWDDNDKEARLDIYARLAVIYQDSPVIDLYLATALWIEEFEESDLETVQKLAAGLEG